ncbi:RING-H2 finger protein ATL39-like [Macadamia integrifolia]|uniref:RING-H2 finger protein ATL39-like n=1 Tax=Macadamia integrifolia TaxID=60698 RepID=UPI001C4FBCF4|nr:RING-H2 finger protein ATL39-like [Macadamia integrifolia]
MALGGSNSSTIMICVIVTLVLVVLLYAMAGWVFRCRARHLAGNVAAIEVPSGEIPSKGLDPSIIAALPLFIYNQSMHPVRECAICLSNIKGEEMAILLPNCKHMFHSQCINMWLNSHTTCPNCRSTVEPQAMPEVLESSVAIPLEDALDDAAESSKVGGLRIPLSSFCRVDMVISSERLERRIQLCGQTDEPEDIERQ